MKARYPYKIETKGNLKNRLNSQTTQIRRNHADVQTIRNRLDATTSRPWPDKPVHIAFVITDLDVGGAERALVNLVGRLDRKRWSPMVIALSDEGALVEVLRHAMVPSKCLGGQRHRPLRLLRRLIQALRQHRPELVQSFLFHANLAARLAAPWAGQPWVLGGLRVAERRKHWHVTLDRLTQFLSAGSVCVSQDVLEFSRHSARLDPSRLTVIPNGIDPEPFDRATAVPRAELGLPEQAILALAVGRLDDQKGIPDLLCAAEQVIPCCPAWHLALAGDGPCRAWLLQELATRPLLFDRVHWLGPRDDIPSLLKSADYLVLASLWEGMPNVILEAMAAGRAVVATAVEGTKELVVDGETGWLVPPHSHDALACALLTAALNPDLRQLAGTRGRARVERNYSLMHTVSAYETLWARLLGYRSL
jgi:starch synthase (maltosyl-transferring)